MQIGMRIVEYNDTTLHGVILESLYTIMIEPIN